MSAPETEPVARTDPEPEQRRKRKTRRLGSLSPWAWGFGVLIVIGVLAVTQEGRLSSIVAAKPQAHPAATGTPTLSGPAYTQSMIASRDFVGANLRGAVLIRLDLRGKDFRRANAAGAVFAGSLLNGANLSHANLSGADLRGACLRGADLTGADLSGADFSGAEVTGAIVTPGATSRAIAWASAPTSPVCPQG